ncbi:LptA/OstA family protein [Meiothermus ruber]|jgi:lipopolysaccharide assembly outer membrane protein LptD (OstA)|uniref:OstA family protein n=1 Tax=Meiothermus ruber (strain ATCC 35948 / DSM 1279 / VKM B-1258 / 21) TaxID=504728 RepID=A0A806CSJ0_MEIRD|nr:LptA/OstA family protein [Meiothermus ruber]ADD28427.1 OstA family protein [Meiothermus ruber DSM 1279]MCL6528968.1 OstA family protein [Meiothermus ruber]GAO75384.1 OstA family protein [Meiothermus ruber H328]
MKRIAWLLFLLALAVLAQSKEQRIITIEAPGGQRSGNLRNGPWVYEAGKPGGVIGRVKDLEIQATRATLEAPQGKTMQEAEGERVASFEGSVVVKRDRMTATGPKLVYRESNGRGTLEGNARMRQEPRDQNGDPVEVLAPRMTFEVDTNISTSEGGVTLKNGRQEGRSEAVYYEEDRGLAVFSDAKEVVLLRKREGKGDLVIRAKEVRSLTDEKRLLATGGVTLVDGDITTTGASLLYNDNTGEATVVAGRVGNQNVPARSVNAKERATLSGNSLLHNVNRSQVRVLAQAPRLPIAEFRKLSER